MKFSEKVLDGLLNFLIEKEIITDTDYKLVNEVPKYLEVYLLDYNDHYAMTTSFKIFKNGNTNCNVDYVDYLLDFYLDHQTFFNSDI